MKSSIRSMDIDIEKWKVYKWSLLLLGGMLVHLTWPPTPPPHIPGNFSEPLKITLSSLFFFFSDHETAIMHRLQTVILEHTKVLMDVMECCAELDWYGANF